MNYLWSESFARDASFPLREDILIQKIILTHDPDGRLLDSELCLRAVEAILSHASASQVPRQEPHCIEICSIQVDGSEEPLRETIYRLSSEIIRLRTLKEDMCTKPLLLFDLLSKYRWDAKLALVLTAFSIIYGEFWVIIQAQDTNPLASSISLIKELPLCLKKYKIFFTAMNLLLTGMVALAKIIVLFERLPILDAELDDGKISTTMSLVYVAAYWICRSVLICASKLADIRASKDSQVSELTLSGLVWNLTSLEHRMRCISDELMLQVNTCQLEVGLKIHQKLLNLSSETQDDNQKVLRMLFSSMDDMPLKHSTSQKKLGTSELANKDVLLLISNPEITPIDELLLLVERIYDHPQRDKLNEGYEIIWIPVASSENWSDNEIIIYDFLSSSLPWYSIRRPWSMSLTTINYIKKEWRFKDEPVIVALDRGGQVRNSNAIDMGWIWGARAFPFSTCKEEELWSQENWTIKLLVDSVSHLLSMWAEGQGVICVYGSSNEDWIREFVVRMKEIQRSVEQLQLQVVYVGKKRPDEKVRNIVASINKGKLSSYLTWNRMQLFWIRLESMRRSKIRLGKTANSDQILRQVEELIETSENDHASGWMIVGRGSSTDTLKLRGEEVIKALSLFPAWQNYITKLGFVNAIRLSQETLPEKPCYHSRIIKYDQATEESPICDNCRRPMKKFIVFDTT